MKNYHDPSDPRTVTLAPDDLQLKFEQTLETLWIYHDDKTYTHIELTLPVVERIAAIYQGWLFRYSQSGAQRFDVLHQQQVKSNQNRNNLIKFPGCSRNTA